MEIETSEISVVMQGAVYPITPYAIACIRRLLPDSQIILSTWEDSDLSKIDNDINIILNRDPHKKGVKYPNNTNRMILSTLTGLKAVRTKYVLKIRTDFYLQNLNFLELFKENPNTDCGMRFLKKRVVCYGWAAQNGRYFQIGDFYHFGLTDDVIDIWNVPLVSDEELFWFKNNSPCNSYYLRSPTNRYHPEQYLWVNFLRKKGVDLDFIDYTDSREKHKKLTEDSFADNLIFASFPEFAVFTPKNNLMNYNLGSGSRECNFSQWVRICKERNNDYNPKINLSRDAQFIRKSKIVYNICYIANIISCFIPIKNIRRKIRNNLKAYIIRKSLYNQNNDNINKPRNFNEIKIDRQASVFTKKSYQTSKITAEREWYKNIPDELQKFCPKVLGFSKDENMANLSLEYIYNPSLSVMFTKEELSQSEFNSILESIFKLYSKFISHKDNQGIGYNFRKIYIDKTLERIGALVNSPINSLISAKEITLNGERIKGFPEIKDEFLKKLQSIAATPYPASVIHGDFCFSNILFDKEKNAFWLVDPRGSFGEGFSVYGDPRYDIAKLRHSFVGLYDFIITDKFLLTESNNLPSFNFKILTDYNVSGLESFFDKLVAKFEFSVDDIKLIEASLFLSAIPLHSENESRQKAFFLIALKKLNEII